MMTDQQKKMKKYCTSIERKLNLPRDVKARVMTDFSTSITAMREAGRSDEEIYAELGSPRKVAAELNDQMKEFTYQKSPWRFVFLVPAVLSGLWLTAYQLALWLFRMVTGASLMVSPSEAASLGVIGGADGPTAIFVTTAATSGVDWDIILVIGILIGCTAGYLRLRKCKRKK